MKQKVKDTSPVTKDELSKILKDYPTKKDLDERFSKFHTAFSAEMDHKFALMMDQFDEKFSKFTSRILTAIDPLMKELETRRDDREMQTVEIADIKKRLTKLENS